MCFKFQAVFFKFHFVRHRGTVNCSFVYVFIYQCKLESQSALIYHTSDVTDTQKYGTLSFVKCNIIAGHMSNF